MASIQNRVVCKYIGNRTQGILFDGTLFKPGIIKTIYIDEQQFKTLNKMAEAGTMEIIYPVSSTSITTSVEKTATDVANKVAEDVVPGLVEELVDEEGHVKDPYALNKINIHYYE